MSTHYRHTESDLWEIFTHRTGDHDMRDTHKSDIWLSQPHVSCSGMRLMMRVHDKETVWGKLDILRDLQKTAVTGSPPMGFGWPSSLKSSWVYHSHLNILLAKFAKVVVRERFWPTGQYYHETRLSGFLSVTLWNWRYSKVLRRFKLINSED